MAVAAGGRVEQVAYEPATVPLVGEFAAQPMMPAGQRTALVVRFPGSGHGRSLLAFAHPDSEPPHGLDAWRFDPFAGTVADGRVYGWGVADDLAGVAIMLTAAQQATRGRHLAGDLILAATPSKRNARGIAALLHRGVRADAALYIHPAESGAGLNEIKAFTAGQLEFRVVVRGEAPATSEPHQTGFAHRGVSAIDKAMALAAALRELDGARAARVRHPVLEGAVGRSTNLMISHLAGGAADALSRFPDRCVLGAALSFPPGEALEAVQAEVEQALRQACRHDDWLAAHPPELIWDTGVSGAETSLDHPFYQIASNALGRVGVQPRLNPMHTGSDIRNPIIQCGIPTIGLGPLCGDLAQNGRRDEWVDVADLGNAVAVTGAVMAAWSGSRGERDYGGSA
ncbi:MAG: M20/M25/M40 family metallo-hydrolase [Methylobacteriaceae bacterium]|nr:M20/M25/M40 family metallo-hydrolase [Methylobacteriaceae bacterium]